MGFLIRVVKDIFVLKITGVYTDYKRKAFLMITKRAIPRGLLLAIVLLIPFFLKAQVTELDSLEQTLRKADLNYDARIRIYDDLSWGYLSVDGNKSVKYAQEGIVLAKSEGDTVMIMTLYRNQGVAYYMISEYNSAHSSLDAALHLAFAIKDEKMESLIYGAIGNIHNKKSEYPQALEYYFKALPMLEKKDNKPMVGLLLHNIGTVYQKLRNEEQALKYLERAKVIAIELDNLETLGNILISMSDLYMETNTKKSINTAKEAVDIHNKVGNKHNEVIAIQTVAKGYYTDEDYVSASDYAEKGVTLAKELNYPSLIAEGLCILSNVRYFEGKYRESEMHAFDALKYDSIDVNITDNLLMNIARSNIHLGNIEKAEEYLDKYRESVNNYANSEYQNAISAMEVSYETEKKELKIAALEEERRLFNWLGIAGGTILLLALGFFILRHRLAVSRRRLAEQQLKQVEQEKQLIAVQAALDGESAERSRLAKDLHDGLGSMLSVVKFNLPPMKSGAVLEATDVSRFQKALGMLDDSIQELRRVAHHMMPESLVRYGLKASLSDFCEAIPTVEFHYFGNEERLPEKLEILIYRSIHELVSNALKHANALQIGVQLVQETDRISFTVQDNGQGFDPSVIQKGMGLENVRQRVDSYGGKMNIYSSDKGTEIHVELDSGN